MCLPVLASDITVSTCTDTNINSVIAAGTTHSGDRLVLTCTGSVTWNTGVTIGSAKPVSMIVQNGTNGTWTDTTTRNARTGANFPLTVIGGSSVTILTVTFAASNPVVEIGGFKFQNSGSADPFIKFTGTGNGSGNLGAFRLHDNYFDTISAVENVAIWAGQSGGTGPLYGLIDNNTFHNVYRASDTDYGPYNIQMWVYFHPTGSNQCWGCTSWTDNDFAYGSEAMLFSEDNLFEQTAGAPAHMRHYISAELGGRYVSRYNGFVNNFGDENADLHDAHGLCLVSSNGAGARGGEIYNNVISGTGYDRGVQVRGGSWLIYNNTITPGGGSPYEFDEYRAETSSSCDTTNNLGVEPPWPVPSNADWSSGAAWNHYVTGGTGYQLPEQIFYSFTWNNRKPDTTLLNVGVDPDYPNVANYIQNNRDYCCDNQTTQPTAVGAHSFSYTPYTYPNPLRGGAANAPTFTAPASCPYTGAAPISVTLSDSNTGTHVTCYTADGSSPATDGTGTACTNGSVYTTTFTESSSVTVKAISGTSTLSDSSITSCGLTVTAVPAVTVKGSGVKMLGVIQK